MLVTIIPVNTLGVSDEVSAADIDGISSDYTLQDGDFLKGTLSNCTITIPKGVTAYIKGTVIIQGTVNIVGGGILKRENSFTSSMFRIPYGKILNIGNNRGSLGVTIDGSNKEIRNVNGGAFNIAGTLNTFKGTVIKNNKVSISTTSIYGGGAIWVKSGGTFNMVSGILTNNSVNMSETFRESSGNYKGGGAVLLHGAMIVTDGDIVGNYSSSVAGAVFIDKSTNISTSNPSFVMNGGIISGNKAELGGGGIKAIGKNFTIGGSAKIIGNTVNGHQDNSYIDISDSDVTKRYYPQISLRYTGYAGFNSSDNNDAGDEFASVSAMIKDSFTAEEAARLSYDEVDVLNPKNLVGQVKEGETDKLVWKSGTEANKLTACNISFLPNTTIINASVTPEAQQGVNASYYQWYRTPFDNKEDSIAIPGAYGSSYTLTGEDVGQYIYCVANGVNGYYGMAESEALYVSSTEYAKVEFDMQEHGEPVSPIVAKIGMPITAPTAPVSNDGYVFGGWYKDSSCIESWNFGTDNVNEDTTLYAEWYSAPTATPVPPATTLAPGIKDKFENDKYRMVYNPDKCVTELWYNNNGTWGYQYYGQSSFGYALMFTCDGKVYNYYSPYFGSCSQADSSVAINSGTTGYSVEKYNNMFKVQWSDLAIGNTGKHFTLSIENVLSDSGILKNFALSTGDAVITDIKLTYGGDTWFGGSDSGLSYRINQNGLAMAYLRQSSGGSLDKSLVMSLTSTDAKSVFAGRYSSGRQWASSFNGISHAENGTEEGDGKGTSSVDNGYYMYWENLGPEITGLNKKGLSQGNIVSTSCFESISDKGTVRAVPAGTKDFAAGSSSPQSESITAFALVNFSADTAEVSNINITNNSAGISTTPVSSSLSLPAGSAALIPVTIDIPANADVGTHTLNFSANVNGQTDPITSKNSIRTRYPSPILKARLEGGTIKYYVKNATEVYLERKVGDKVEEIRDGLITSDTPEGEANWYTYTLKQGGSYILKATNPSTEVAVFNIGTTFKINAAVVTGGGGSVIADSYVAEGQSITLNAYSVDNYEFENWYTDAAANTVFNNASTGQFSIDTTESKTEGNHTTLKLDNVKQDITLYVNFKQKPVDELDSGKVYVFYKESNESIESQYGSYDNLLDAYNAVNGLTSEQRYTVRYILTGNQELLGNNDQPVSFTLDDGQILTGAGGSYTVTVKEYASLNIGKETISNTCNSKTGVWHTGEGQIDSTVDPVETAKGANVASGISLISDGGQIALDGQRSTILTPVSLYPDNKLKLVSDLNTGNYIKLTLMNTDDWTDKVCVTTDGTDGDASDTD